MNPAFETYKLAFLGRILSGAKSVAKFTGQVPLWIGGALAVDRLIGKKPEVRRVVLPPSKIEALRQPQPTFQDIVEQYRKYRFMAGSQ